MPDEPLDPDAQEETAVDRQSILAIRFGLFGFVGMPGAGLVLRSIAAGIGSVAGNPASYFFIGVVAWGAAFAFLGLRHVSAANEALQDPDALMPKSTTPFWAGLILTLANLVVALVMLIVLASTGCLSPFQCGL